MSDWKHYLKEESEYQWLSFAAFAAIIIIGAILIDWSSDLSGVRQGAIGAEDGMVIDKAGNAVLYRAEDGTHLKLDGIDSTAPFATCITEHQDITYACVGTPGELMVNEDKYSAGEWRTMTLSSNLSILDVSGNKLALMMIVQDGTATTLAGVFLEESLTVSPLTQNEGDMHLTSIVAHGDGWIVSGSWQAPVNFLGSNPTSPPLYELVLKVIWDGVSAPTIEDTHIGGIGQIHSLISTDEGVIAAGTFSSLLITDSNYELLDLTSSSAIADDDGNVWFFGEVGSTTVALYEDGEIEVKKLPAPLQIQPQYAFNDQDGVISVHGDTGALSIDTEARQSFTSLRGIMDLTFILFSLTPVIMMLWNVADSIRTGEEF